MVLVGILGCYRFFLSKPDVKSLAEEFPVVMTTYHYRSTACCILAQLNRGDDLHCGNGEIRDRLH